MLGAGGVGRAMAFGLTQGGARLTLTDIDEKRAQALAGEVGAETLPISEVTHGGSSALRGGSSDLRGGSSDLRGGSPYPPRLRYDLLLNCTPIGMHPKVDASPVPREMLRPEMVVYDAVYNPIETRLLREAREAGCRTVAGIDHFVRQAVEQFELWTGRPAPVETMRRVLVEALRR
jgi:shikimate 5-dehydrogenase